MSKTNSKQKQTTAVSTKTVSGIENMSFDEIMAMDEKEREKLINEGQKKDQKRLQLISKVGGIKGDITNLKTKYLKSLTDVSMDSIDIRISIKIKEEELMMAEEIYNQLFPKSELGGSMCIISPNS